MTRTQAIAGQISRIRPQMFVDKLDIGAIIEEGIAELRMIAMMKTIAGEWRRVRPNSKMSTGMD